MPNIVRTAQILALLMVAYGVVGALTTSIVVLPFVLIPLFSLIGISRRRVWGAYGFALYLSAELLFLPLLFTRRAGYAADSAKLIGLGVLLIMCAAVFWLAGRALAAAGAERGRALPWVALSAVLTLPLLFFEPYFMPSVSMENTLLRGDRFLVRLFPKPRLERGDIVLFPFPINPSETYVKRIVGVPGDHIRIASIALPETDGSRRAPHRA